MLTFWEYRVVHAQLNDGSAGERTLNEFGMEGWELVTENDVHYPPSAKRWVFKRPKATTREAQRMHVRYRGDEKPENVLAKEF